MGHRERLKTAIHSLRSLTISLSPAVKDSLFFFFAGRLFYTLIGIFIWWSKFRPAYAERFYYEISPVLNGLEGALFGVWQRWDSIHYLRIATFDYANNQLSLFYPLYPLLGRWLAQGIHCSTLVSLILISNGAFFLSIFLLHKIVSQFYSQKTVRSTLAALVLFPSSFYFFAIYPQSLLLFLILLTYYLIRRGCWIGGAITGFLAGLTHSTSVALFFLVGIEALRYLWPKWISLRQRRFVFEWKILLVLFAPFTSLLGIASFIIWREMAGFPPYVLLQSMTYGRALTMPWEGLRLIIQFIINPPSQVNIIVAWMNTAVFALMVFLTVWSYRRIPLTWWFMQMGFLVFITTSLTVGYPLIGFFRYSVVIFPLFIEIALLGRQPPWPMVKFAIGLFLSFSYSAMFFMWLYDF